MVACSALRRACRDLLRACCPDLRLVFLEGDAALIGPRQAARRDHYMPASLLASQYAALEPPGAEERPITVSVAPVPEAVAEAVLAALRRGE